MNPKALPIGIDDFKKLIRKDCYYVDKTLLIKELLDKKSEVNLFTRPRRFGKTLSISMLQYFFENTGEDSLNRENHELFLGMKIMGQGKTYTDYMQKYPVISISLKSAKQPNWEHAYYCLRECISRQFSRHMAALESLILSNEKEKFLRLAQQQATPAEYGTSLEFLCYCLQKYYNEKVIILIDEYDVPLENAYFRGFYNQMVDFIRTLFESALKTNRSLEFAVITGCLRITKESIFTGLNNLSVISILDESYGEYFGFVPQEVEQMLAYYNRSSHMETVKEWYDGYSFGSHEVYNPWSIVNYVQALAANPLALPAPYWSNTSSNSIVKELIEDSGIQEKDEIERLIAGETIEKSVHEEITYEDVHSSKENLWNFLFFTGYLKQTGRRLEQETQYVTLAIPNLEVRYIYKNTVRSWFDRSLKKRDLSALFGGIRSGNASIIEEELSRILLETISFYDYAESYYHGFLAGILENMPSYLVQSNREEGQGRPDIFLRTRSLRDPVMILELKTAKTFQEMDKKCEEALRQIAEEHYVEGVQSEGYQTVLAYGICFYKKECMVKLYAPDNLHLN